MGNGGNLNKYQFSLRAQQVVGAGKFFLFVTIRRGGNAQQISICLTLTPISETWQSAEDFVEVPTHLRPSQLGREADAGDARPAGLLAIEPGVKWLPLWFPLEGSGNWKLWPLPFFQHLNAFPIVCCR